MKNTRWIYLAAVFGVLVAGGVWAGLNLPPRASQIEPDQQIIDTTSQQQNTETPVTPADSGENPDDATPPTAVPSGQELVEFAFGEGSYGVDKIHLQPIDIDEDKQGKPLERWLKDEFPEASTSLIRTWVQEKRISSSNWIPAEQANNPIVEIINTPQHISALNDKIFISVSEFSALRVVMEDYLADPLRKEFQLFEITIYPEKHLEIGVNASNGSVSYVVTEERYLAVGPLFLRDIDRVPPHSQLDPEIRNALEPWEKSLYVGDFGPYRLYELD